MPIVMGVCEICKTGAVDAQPVGWVRVTVNARQRLPDEQGARGPRAVITNSNRSFTLCAVCFDDWWKGAKVNG